MGPMKYDKAADNINFDHIKKFHCIALFSQLWQDQAFQKPTIEKSKFKDQRISFRIDQTIMKNRGIKVRTACLNSMVWIEIINLELN